MRGNETNSVICRIVRTKQKNIAAREPHRGSLPLERFTAHICGPSLNGQSGRNVWQMPFKLPEEMVPDIEWAIVHAPQNKATGNDGVFSEALAVTKSTSALIVALWRAIGRVAYTPRQWRKIVMVPLHKAGDRDVPANFRSMAHFKSCERGRGESYRSMGRAKHGSA